MRVARRAGSQQATRATAVSSPETSTSASGLSDPREGTAADDSGTEVWAQDVSEGCGQGKGPGLGQVEEEISPSS